MGQDPLAPVHPAGAHHRHERPVIVDRGEQHPAAVGEPQRRRPPAVVWIVDHRQPAAVVVGCVERHQPRLAVGRDRERRGGHAERVEDPASQHRLEGRALGACEQHAEHLPTRVVHPGRAGLVYQGQRAERSDPTVVVVVDGGPRRRADAAQAERRLRPLDRKRPRRCHHRSEAHPVGQHVTDGDRPLRRHGVVELGIDRPEHAFTGQLRQQVVDRLAEVEGAVGEHRQRGRGDDGLGQRGDAPDRVAPVAVGRRIGPIR